MKLFSALMIVLGATGCLAPANDAAFCRPFYAGKVADLRGALIANPQTPDAVGEAATDVVIGHEAGCRKG